PVATPSSGLDIGGTGGQTIGCDPSNWTGSPSFTYQWYRNGVALSGNGADTNTYTVQTADLATPSSFQCQVTATNASGGLSLVSAAVPTNPAPETFGGVSATMSTSQTGALVSGGVSDDGETVFFGEAGNLFAFDVATRAVTPIATSGDARYVNI